MSSRAHTIALFEPAAGSKRPRPAIPAFLQAAETALARASTCYDRLSLLEVGWALADNVPVDERTATLDECRCECLRVQRFHARWERTLKIRLRDFYTLAAVLGEHVAQRQETRLRSISTAASLLESGSTVTTTVRTQEWGARWALKEACETVSKVAVVLKRALPADLVCKIFVFAGVDVMQPVLPAPIHYAPIVLSEEEDEDDL